MVTPRTPAAERFSRERPWLYPGLRVREALLLGAGAPDGNGAAPLLPQGSRPMGDAEVRLASGAVALDDALVALGAAPFAARQAVASYGSNCDPVVLARKFELGGVSEVVPVAPGRLGNAGLAAAAHVSRPGYIPAGVVRREGMALPVVVAWLDDEQVRCLDATEGNYERRTLDRCEHPVLLDSGQTVADADLYVPGWGVLPLAAEEALNQVAVWRAALRLSDSLQEVAGVAPDAPEEALVALMVRLAGNEALRTRARECLVPLAADCGFAETGRAAARGALTR